MLSWLLGAETEAEKELQLCIDKATSALIIAPDQSDIAAIVAFTWDHQSSLSVWVRLSQIADSYNNSVADIRLFKTLIILYHVLQDGHPSALTDAWSLSLGVTNWSRFELLLNQNENHGASGVENLWHTFGTLIHAKLTFHRKYPEFKGTIAYGQIQSHKKPENGQNIYIVELMQLQDWILLYQTAAQIHVLSSKTEMAALVPLIKESFTILQCVTRLLENSCHGPTIPLSIQRDLPRFREQYNSCHKFFTSYKGIDWLTRRANIPSTELSLPEFAQGGPPPSTQIQDLESQIAVWERRHAAEQELQKTHQNTLQHSLEQERKNEVNKKDAEIQNLKQRLAISEKKHSAISELHAKLRSDHEELLGQLEGWRLVPVSETNDLPDTSRTVSRISAVQSEIAKAAMHKFESQPNRSAGATGNISLQHPTTSRFEQNTVPPRFAPRVQDVRPQVDNAVVSGVPPSQGRNPRHNNRGPRSGTTAEQPPPRAPRETPAPQQQRGRGSNQPRHPTSGTTTPNPSNNRHKGGRKQGV